MIKIFTPRGLIYLASDTKQLSNKGYDNIVQVNSAKEMEKAYKKFINNANFNHIIFTGNTDERSMEYYTNMYKLIVAAGGMVKNKSGQWLFIFRNGKWDLPKGKVEKGEDIKNAAIREVEEECGVKGLNILNALPCTYHTYVLKGKNLLKQTYWYEMSCDDDRKLVPQIEEGITQVKWVDEKEIKELMNNTFESVKDVVRTLVKL